MKDYMDREKVTPEQKTLALLILGREIAAALEKAKRDKREGYEAVMLYENEGLPYKEIAERQGIKLTDLKMRIFRTRRFIQRDVYLRTGYIA